VDIEDAGRAASGERSGARDIVPRIGGEEIDEVVAVE
jgi:hypothetical protein